MASSFRIELLGLFRSFFPIAAKLSSWAGFKSFLSVRYTPDVETRRALMKDIETILRDSGIMIQPYWRSVYRSYREGVNGFRMQQAFEAHLDNVWLSA